MSTVGFEAQYLYARTSPWKLKYQLVECMNHDDLLRSWKLEENMPFQGWDFSYIASRSVTEPPLWSYCDCARELMSSSTTVLDLGTGGGEILLSMKDIFPQQIVATEEYPPNAILAHERLLPYGDVIETGSSSLEQRLPLADERFDLVIDRHTCFNTLEVARILKPGGIFMTEQVDGRDLYDLCRAFDCMPQWAFFTLDFALDRIITAGLIVDVAREWNGKTVFKDVGAIVYYLKAIPWIVPGFSVETHCKYLLKLQDRIDREGELAFTRKLLFVKAKKV